MYNVQQNNVLPVSADQAVYGDWNLNQGLPVNYGPPQAYPGMAGVMQKVVATIINLLQERKTQNNFRMFLFNMAAANTYNNPYMCDIVSNVAELAAVALCSSNNVNEDNVIYSAADEVLACIAMANINAYPALQMYFNSTINQNTYNTVMQTLATIRNTVNLHKNSMLQRGGQVVMPGQMHQQIAMPQNNNVQQSHVGSNFGALLNNGGSSAPNNTPDASLSGRYDKRMANTGPVNELPKVQVVNQVPVAPVAPAAPATVVEKELKWMRSKEYPYYPAVNSILSKVVLRQDPDNSNVIIPTIVSKERLPMDYNKHALGFGFGKLIDVELISNTPTKKLSVLDANNTELESAVKLSLKNDKPITDYTGTINDKMAIDTSLDNVFSNVAYELRSAQLSNPDRKIVMFRQYSAVLDIILLDPATAEKDKEIFSDLSSIDSYTLLCATLSAVGNQMSLGLYTKINRRLTNHINNLLKTVLSLDIDIDSFVDDFNDLINVLITDYDETIAVKLMKDEAKVISCIFDTSMSKQAKDECTVKQGENDIVLDHVYMAHYYSATVLDMVASDLTIEFDSKFACQILPTENTELYGMAKALFDDDCPANNYVETHLVKLQDGYTFEISRGCFGADSFLLTLVDE